jgi:hypothetical protein
MSRLTTIQHLRAVRNWCTVLAIGIFAVALTCLPSIPVNPKVWSSTFYALAASGELIRYAGWLAVAGGLFLGVAVLLALCIRTIER